MDELLSSSSLLKGFNEQYSHVLSLKSVGSIGSLEPEL